MLCQQMNLKDKTKNKLLPRRIPNLNKREDRVISIQRINLSLEVAVRKKPSKSRLMRQRVHLVRAKTRKIITILIKALIRVKLLHT